jgi:uncharacterized protein (DUF362 family)
MKTNTGRHEGTKKNGRIGPVVYVRHLDQTCAPSVFSGLLDSLLADSQPCKPERIVIKINLCEYRRPESGAVTDPVLLCALVDALKVKVPECPILIAESDATTLDADSAFRYMSVDKVAIATGATLVNFTKGEWREMPLPEGKVFKSIWMPSLLDNQTLYVNFSKLKINSGTKITGCLKNNYALIRDKNKAQYHPVVDEAVHDINVALIRKGVRLLNIIDGYIGMETMGGPAFGRPKKCNLLIGSVDPVAVDTCESRIIGIRPASVKHIKYCCQSGLGSMRYTLVTDIPNFRYGDYKFDFEAFQYWLRQKMKKRAGVGL